MDKAHRRLVAAYALSMLLHASVVAPWGRWRHDPPADGVQTHLAATLVPRPPAQEKPPERPPGKEKAPAGDQGNRRLLSAPGAEPGIGPAAGKPTPEPEGADESAAAYSLQPAQPPEYPEAARRAGQEGCVLASVSIADTGDVERVQIVAADLPGVFDQAVIDSQQTARYAPATGRDGSALPSRVLAVAEFVLTPGTTLRCPLKYAPLAERLMAEGRP